MLIGAGSSSSRWFHRQHHHEDTRIRIDKSKRSKFCALPSLRSRLNIRLVVLVIVGSSEKMTMSNILRCVVAYVCWSTTTASFLLVSGFPVSCLVGQATAPTTRAALSMQQEQQSSEDISTSSNRRGFLQAAATTVTTTSLLVPSLLLLATTTPASADTGAEVRGTSVNAFNGLAFQYRGSDFAGLRAEDIKGEPSIPYAEFVERLKKGEVEYVEFLAPDGDAAYATFKDKGGTPIRIGEGYPIEQHDGYSSPAFAIRTVKNAGVPYKFVVPALVRK